MKTRYSLLLTGLLVLLGACGSAEPGTSQPETADTDVPVEVYGEAFERADALPVQAVAAEPEQFVGQVVRIEGRVADVCQMAGCWLTLQTTDGNNVRIAVARDDEGAYRFTVPKDISGRRVVVQGMLSEKTLSAETQRHLAEDAGEAADTTALAPKKELNIVATGVIIEQV